MKKRAFLLVLLLTFFCFAGCGNDEPAETDPPESPERPAETDAVALIPKDGILEIEDETGTYEVVYAEGLKEIKMDEDTNVLVSADDENFVYTFENADYVLKMMREGDVFCGILPDSGEALAVVVERVEKNGDSVTVYGVQPTLEDLFESIEIEATYGADALVIDELAEGVTVEETPTDPSLYSKDGLRATSLATKKVPPNHTFRVGLDIQGQGRRLKGMLAVTFENVTVSVKYRGGSAVDTVVAVRTTQAFEFEMGVYQGWTYDEPIGEFHIPTNIPLLTFPIGLNAYASFNGRIGGGVSGSFTTLNGVKTSTSNSDSADTIGEVVRQAMEFDLVECEADAKIGVKARLGVAIAKTTVRVDLALLVGLKVEAEYATTLEWNDTMESVHDCSACIDGELSVFCEGSVDGRVNIVPRKPPTWSLSCTLVEFSVPIKSFYYSVSRGDHVEPRFGWGECPYRRYRTEVTVTSKYGEIYGAEVHAQYPDGRTDHQWADEFGMAVFWLPAGQNWLDAEYNERINGDYYTISEEPSRQEIELEFDQRVVIVCNFLEIDYTGEENSANYVPAAEFGEIYGKLTTGASQAEVYSVTTWEEYDNPILLYGGKEKKQLRPGDILVELSSGYDVYSGREGYGGFSGKVSMMVKPWNGKPVLRVIGYVQYDLELEMASEFLPEVHWLTPGGKENLLTGVYFRGYNSSGYLECTDFFDEISYSYDSGGNWDSMPKVEYWSGREVLRTEYWEWDYTYQFIVNETVEETHYIERNYGSWGNALVGQGMRELMSHLQRARVH